MNETPDDIPDEMPDKMPDECDEPQSSRAKEMVACSGSGPSAWDAGLVDGPGRGEGCCRGPGGPGDSGVRARGQGFARLVHWH